MPIGSNWLKCPEISASKTAIETGEVRVQACETGKEGTAATFPFTWPHRTMTSLNEHLAMTLSSLLSHM